MAIAEPTRVIPLTDTEIKEIQLSIVDRMLEINREVKSGRIPMSEEVSSELRVLSGISLKVHKYTR